MNNKIIKYVLLLSGVFTLTMLYAAIAPEKALESFFGDTLSGNLSLLITRNWGMLIAINGGMLIYAAFKLEVRSLVLFVSIVSKSFFVILNIYYGYALIMIFPVILDSILVIIYIVFLSTKKYK